MKDIADYLEKAQVNTILAAAKRAISWLPHHPDVVDLDYNLLCV
jgi:hypothetical protein